MFFYRLCMPVDMTHVWIALCLTIGLYLCLYVYLDAIIPQKYGIAHSCCYCLKRHRRKKISKKASMIEQDLVDSQDGILAKVVPEVL